MTKSKILIVDDIETNITAVKSVLEPLNIDVYSANSGKEALSLILRHEFAVVILDVQMPGMDGFETAKLIRLSEKNEHLPIIFVTGMGDNPKLILEAYGSGGAADYLLKPVDPVQLRSKVSVFIELDQQRDHLKTIARSEEILRETTEKQNKKLRIQSKLWLAVGCMMLACIGSMFYYYRVSERNYELQTVNQQITKLNKSYERFVPHEFISLLGKKSITEVQLGDEMLQAMPIMFFDVKGFTTITEQMSAKEIINLMNELFDTLQPIISEYGGIINKYLGDGAMVIFPGGEKDAMRAAIDITKRISILNKERAGRGLKKLFVGIGLDSGPVILGTVGGSKRLEHTVYGNAVNLASRIEGLTRKYGVSLLITENVYSRLGNDLQKHNRIVDNVQVKGKTSIVTIYENYGWNDGIIAARESTKKKYNDAFKLYQKGQFVKALKIFNSLLEKDPKDNLVKYHIAKCKKLKSTKFTDWKPIELFSTK